VCNVTAVASGPFDSPATWSGGVVPVGRCTIRIPANIEVTLSDGSPSIGAISLRVDGKFTIAVTGSASFIFRSSISIVVGASGALNYQIESRQLYCAADSMTMVLPGGRVFGAGIQVYIYAIALGPAAVIDIYTMETDVTGPFTFVLTPTGLVQTYTTLTFIIKASGSINDSSVFVGNLAVDDSICGGVSAQCGLIIPRGFQVLTRALGGVWSIRLARIVIETGASLSFGSPSSDGDFIFQYLLVIYNYGTVSYVGKANTGIRMSFGSSISFFGTASFSASFSVFIRFFNLSTGNAAAGGLLLSAGLRAPFFAGSTLDGQVSSNTNRKS
jgi:hypothetical protein